MSDTISAPMSKTNASLEALPTHNESMVVQLNQLDKMLDLAGEVIIISSNLGALSRQISVGATLSATAYDDVRDLAVTSSRISSDLHRLVSNVRTVPMGHLFMRFRRLVRDTSRRLGKTVHFELHGEDVLVDKKLSEHIYDPIAHQLRNAIAHGVEDEQTRLQQGKDPVGTISLRVLEKENSTVIEVCDNGAGINPEAIRKRIVAQGLLEPDKAAGLTTDQLHDYLFMPGFSTMTTASTTAGRGVGLDVVRSVIHQLEGDMRIQSTPGNGTTFSTILPKITAVNISDALLVHVNQNSFAFPITSVVASLSVGPDEITTTTGRGRSIIYLGHILPVFDLLEVLGEPGVPPGDTLRILIVEYKHRQAAFVVSDFGNPQKIVITEFSHSLSVPGLTGTAILSGRHMALVVDLPVLMELTFGKASLSSVTESLLPCSQEECGADDEPPTPQVAAITDTVALPDSEFLIEVETMLELLNRELLQLDEKRDMDTAHAVFRLMHSIKGNLTMYGADEPASVTHDLETLLARIRSGVLDMHDDLFGILFDGLAYLEDTVGLLLKQQATGPIPQRLAEGLDTFSQKQTDMPPDTVDFDNQDIELDSMGQFTLSSRRRAGTLLRQCVLEFDPGDQPAFLVAYLIITRLQSKIDVLGTLPALTDIENGLCHHQLKVLVAPHDAEPDIFERLSNNLKHYYGVKRFDVLPYA
jgi:chemotaxis protein histidine kinase CheA